MIYNIYEFNRYLSLGVNALASSITDANKSFLSISTSYLKNNPFSPFSMSNLNSHSPNIYSMAGFELLRRLTKDYKKPEFEINEVIINNKSYKVNQSTVHAKHFCNLLKFEKIPSNKKERDLFSSQSTILIVAPLSGHHATLLRETVRKLLENHHVYITDWIDAKNVPVSGGDFGLDDYVCYLDEFMDEVKKTNKSFSLLAVCQPVVPALASVCLRNQSSKPLPSSLILMGGPVDARKCPTSVNEFATSHSLNWFESNLIYKVPLGYDGSGREVYPGFLQHMGFVAMNPNHHYQSHVDYHKSLLYGYDDKAEKHKQFYNEYNAVLDLPAKYYLDTIDEVFHKFSLAKGKMKINKEKIQPEKLKNMRLLTIEGEKDDISGTGQTRAALDLCKSIPTENKKHFTAQGVGHYGLFSGKRWRENIAPVISSFIDKK